MSGLSILIYLTDLGNCHYGYNELLGKSHTLDGAIRRVLFYEGGRKSHRDCDIPLFIFIIYNIRWVGFIVLTVYNKDL